MLTAGVIRQRIQTAERYLELIDAGFVGSWHDAYRDVLVSGDLVLGLALIHPEYWSGSAAERALLGPREFRVPTLRGTRNCASADYWGAPCPSAGREDVEIVADHAWPFSLGGPTVVGNIRWLCRRHNAVKSSDVHLYPWEGLWPGWLSDHLRKVARAVPE